MNNKIISWFYNTISLKSILIFFVIVIIGISICIYAFTSKISIIDEESFFSDFEVIDNEVFIYCVVTLKNNYKEEKSVKMYSDMKEDVEIGLLKKSKLEGKNTDNNSKIFVLPAESTITFNVVFIGEYGGINRKHDRLLPKIDITILNFE